MSQTVLALALSLATAACALRKVTFGNGGRSRMTESGPLIDLQRRIGIICMNRSFSNPIRYDLGSRSRRQAKKQCRVILP